MKGFTLVELMVSIAIVAILATIGTVYYGQTRATARDGIRKADLQSVRTALEVYKQANGRYPDCTPQAGTSWGESDVNPGNYIAGNFNTYLQGDDLPLDPVNNATYHYSYCRFPAGDNGCSPARPYYVFGIRKFEVSSKDTKIQFDCGGSDWSSILDMSWGEFE